MATFEKYWAPVAVIIGALLLVINLLNALQGNKTLVTFALIFVSLVAIIAAVWKYAFALSDKPFEKNGRAGFYPKYKFHWLAKVILFLAFISILFSIFYILTFVEVIPDYCGFIPAKTPTSTQVNSAIETVTLPVPTGTAITTSIPDLSVTLTPSPTLEVENQLIQLIDNYYTCLNAAKPDDDSTYDTCWNLLSNRPGEFQDNMNKSNSGYGFDNYLLFWRTYKVTYYLYFCTKDSEKLVDVEYDLYKSSDLSISTGKNFGEYSFGLDSEGWRIKAFATKSRIGSYCENQPRIEKLTITP